jgi:PBP1b-binding outer membrane lipoprotein LpoB
MKKIIAALFLATTLSGCALYDAYFMAKYDNIEYALTNKIRTVSQLSVDQCKDQEVSKENFLNLYVIAVELHNYAQYTPRNVDAYKITSNLVDLTKQGREMYAKSNPVSETFCKLKLQQVNRSAELAQKVIGSKPR